MITKAAPTGAQGTGAQARRVAINSLAPFGATMAGRVLAWGMAVVMARTLGPEGTGAYAFAVNLWLYASIVADFGLGTWLTREVARAPEAIGPAVALSLGLRLALSAAAGVALVLVALLYAAFGIGGAGPEIVATTALLAAGLLPGAISGAGTALFNARERMVFPAALQLVSAALTTVAGSAALLAGHGIVALGWVSLGVNAVTAALFWTAMARASYPMRAVLAPAKQWALARETLPLMLNGLLNNVFFRVDIQVLQSQGSAVVGYYANAYKVIDAAGAVPSSFVLALFPVLARRAAGTGTGGAGGAGGAGGEREGMAVVYALALKLLLVAGLGLAVLLAAVAHDLTLLSWGPAFLPDSAVALQVLVWFLPLSFFNGLTQYVLIALGQQARITPAFAAAALFNVSANLLLVPRFSYVAAAGATIATEVVLLIPFLLALRERLDVGRILRAAGRTLPAGALLGLVCWLPWLPWLPWPDPAPLPAHVVRAAVGALAYPALVLATGVFGASERRVLLSLVRR
jgi:O-antigen/teichoic acid export membrane protein